MIGRSHPRATLQAVVFPWRGLDKSLDAKIERKRLFASLGNFTHPLLPPYYPLLFAYTQQQDFLRYFRAVLERTVFTIVRSHSTRSFFRCRCHPRGGDAAEKAVVDTKMALRAILLHRAVLVYSHGMVCSYCFFLELPNLHDMKAMLNLATPSKMKPGTQNVTIIGTAIHKSCETHASPSSLLVLLSLKSSPKHQKPKKSQLQVLP